MIDINMTYARARLWLGITGVGSFVVIAVILLLLRVPQNVLSRDAAFGVNELVQLFAIAGWVGLWLLPLDFLGGYWIPRKYQRSQESFGLWFRGYLRAVLVQSSIFVACGSLIMVASQRFGVLGGALSIGFAIAACFVVRNALLLRRELKSASMAEKLMDAVSLIQSWQIFVPPTVVVEHRDVGFTGGIIGLGERSTIVIPKAWLAMTKEQLATAIARRAVAINTGSYRLGLMFAVVWNVGGFLISSMILGAGLETVAGLATTICGFTIWSFIGLLALPTVSRNASLAIDQQLVRAGMPEAFISATASLLDQMQDDEPERPALIETIFHPIPNVKSRSPSEPIRGFAAWNVARTTLFFSWACFGVLSRSVHCNVGRPELWSMLPTD